MLIKHVETDNISVELIPHEAHLELEQNYYSVLVGANGLGKSRILEAIAACGMMFQLVNENQEGSKYSFSEHTPMCYLRHSNFKKIKITFFSNDESKMNAIAAERYFYKFAGFVQRTEAEPQPSPNTLFHGDYVKYDELDSIICISNGAFDKFPSLSEPWFRKSELSKYFNLSTLEYIKKSRGEDISAVKMLSKEILSAFFTDQDSFEKGMDFLYSFGFADEISLSLQINDDLYGIGYNGIDDREGFLHSFQAKGSLHEKEIAPELEAIINETLKELKKDIPRESISLIEDMPSSFWNKVDTKEYKFDRQSNVNTRFYRNIKILSDYDILQLRNISFSKGDGQLTKLNGMSSGEINILLTLFRINSKIKDNALILIDEPEVSLHPAWQRNVIPTIERCFSNYKGCHFIIATHSPQVVSSIPESNSSVIILGEKSKTLPGFMLKGMSADYLLFSTLDSPGEHNEYAVRMLTTILAKLNLRKELSVKEALFLERAIELYPLDNKDDEYVSIKHLLKQVITLYAA
ncbi:TPA: AAA family ATPase [Klebsiella pneumoniae]|nr:AAA family ATPase [Klebsiella pneumoniae]